MYITSAIHQKTGYHEKEGMNMEETEDRDGTTIINLKEKIEELVDNLNDIEISGAVFFIGVDNRTGELFPTLSRVDIPAEKDKRGAQSSRMYDHEFRMAPEEKERLKYKNAEICLGRENDGFVVRIKTGGKEDV